MERENGAHAFALRRALKSPVFLLRETVELPRGRRCWSRPRAKSALALRGLALRGSSRLGLERALVLNLACGIRPCPCPCPCLYPWLNADPGGDGDSEENEGEGEGEGDADSESDEDGESWLFRISSDLRFPRVGSLSRIFSHASAALVLGTAFEGAGTGMGAASSADIGVATVC